MPPVTDYVPCRACCGDPSTLNKSPEFVEKINQWQGTPNMEYEMNQDNEPTEWVWYILGVVIGLGLLGSLLGWMIDELGRAP